MDVDDAPLAVHPAQQHGFHRTAVDGAAAIGAGHGFDAHHPCGIALLAVRPADQRARHGGAEGGVGLQMMAGIFGAAAFHAAGFEDQGILGQQRLRGGRVAAGER